MSWCKAELSWLLVIFSCITVLSQNTSNGDYITGVYEVFGPPPKEDNQPVDGGNGNFNGNEQIGGSQQFGNDVAKHNEGFTGDNKGLGGDQCQCVPYYLCANNSIITDGTGLLDIRIKGEQCENYMDVCCGEPLDPDNAIKPKPHGRLGCGKRNIDGVGFRITGNVDNEAQFGEFPWMVAILKQDTLEDGSKLSIYQCGGSLIHEQVVLTAAHCIIGKDASVLKVRAGEWDTQTKNELYAHQDRSVAQIIIHEKYYSGALYNDIALLILHKPFEFADNVDITCLPLQGDVVLENECFASGWGKDVFEDEIIKVHEETPPGSDGDLGVRFLSNSPVKPFKSASEIQKDVKQSKEEPILIRSANHDGDVVDTDEDNTDRILFPREKRQTFTHNFAEKLLNGFKLQQHQLENDQQSFAQQLFNGFKLQQQDLQEKQQHFVQQIINGFQQQSQQQELRQPNENKPTNLLEGLIQGVHGVVQKKVDKLKTKTEQFLNIDKTTTGNVGEIGFDHLHNIENHHNEDVISFVKPTTTRRPQVIIEYPNHHQHRPHPHQQQHQNRPSTYRPPIKTTVQPHAVVPGKEGHYQVILKRVDLPMVPRDKCVSELRKTRLGPYFRLHDSFVCAGGVLGKDTCKGDGGSPLVCPIPGRDYQYQQVGIVAWGIGCGNETPAVYVNVAKFRDWIDNHMKRLNFRFEYNY